MTHFFATVCVGPGSSEAVVDAVTAALAPFDINGDPDGDFDPRRHHWDRWNLHAPRDFLQLRPEFAMNPRQLRAPEPPDGNNAVVAAPKFMIDFDGMTARSRTAAAAAWDAWSQLTAAHPGSPLPLTHFMAAQGATGADAARQDHLAQPAVQEFAKLAVAKTHPYFTVQILLADPVEHFGMARNEYVDQAAAEVIATHAYVTLDGRWYDQHTEGLTAIRHARAIKEYIDNLPGDTVLAMVYCHN